MDPLRDPLENLIRTWWTNPRGYPRDFQIRMVRPDASAGSNGSAGSNVSNGPTCPNCSTCSNDLNGSAGSNGLFGPNGSSA